MALPRFLVPEMKPHQTMELPPVESHHASRVLRCSEGDVFVLFDGRGYETNCAVVRVDKRSVHVQAGELRFAPRDHDDQLHLAVAMPKGDRQKSSVEKLVELGVDSLIPISTSRSVAVIDEDNRERVERYAIEACKQCGRNRLMLISNTLTIAELLTLDTSAAYWILHPSNGDNDAMTMQSASEWNKLHRPQRIVLMVGPEGGFSDDEVDAAVQRGAKMLTLGDRILRVETAVTAAALLGSLWLSKANEF